MRAHPAGPLHGNISPPPAAGAPPAVLGALDPLVWPRSAQRVDGELHLGGLPVTALVREHGTPLFVLDEADFRSRAADFTDAFAGADVHYASKAFLCGQVARWVAEDGLHLDACSGNELAVALAAGFPAERIALHGNNKSLAELQLAVDAGIGHVVLDSFDEIDRLVPLAQARVSAGGAPVPVLIRSTVGIEAHTHEFIATAHEDQKFGFSLATGDALTAAVRVIREPALRLAGLHSHIGSQIFDTAGFDAAAHRVVGLMGQVHQATGEVLTELNLGGGFGIAYLSEDDPVTPGDVAARLRSVVAAECAALDLPVPRLAVEPGRAIAGPGTVTLYEIGTIKPVRLGASGSPGTPLVRNYVSVDGGMSDNIRTALYDASYTCVLANRESQAPPALCRVVGKHCESGDILVRDLWLPADVVPGDLLAVAATGAYCWSMASNYNYLLKPPVVAVREGRATGIVRRQTLADVFALDAVLADVPAPHPAPSQPAPELHAEAAS
ncbi:diaminopimelate decarboxylase [Modestobacter sp. I12A-02628]|uniref:Diaminopimelate decarboxylase n=1 Tax=Goekera deserti TaxID=2497753 RepID=A0A7K3WA94_9ACTN|nr:diaminopimelate decarboxylase [Goekera deserti]MPQ99922.1 diaminopimelate decarboxylase [Goekera deserti]NDI50081.1 diaminopimelate decarboxylase [Goekera deserti]NEL52443.1 diaminopimelate decarboxylase [Goekera deserti]